MTIKEMLKKIEAYNEVTEHLTIDRACLCFEDQIGPVVCNREYITDYNSFALFIRANYIKEMAKAILSFDRYEFGERFGITNVYDLAGEIKATVTFSPVFQNH